MKLSEHFTLAEAAKSQRAVRLGIDNRPPETLHAALRLVAVKILEPVRAHFGIPFSPSSWYRCQSLNDAVGSKPTSQHMKGEAVDLELPGVPNIVLARWIAENLEFDQLILEFWRDDDPTAGWVHVSYRAANNRGEILTIGDGVRRHGLPDKGLLGEVSA